MTFPVYKIEIYNTAGALIHTIISGAWDIYVKEILTSGIGTFRFILPGQIGLSYFYNNIGCNYKAKMFLGYDSIGAGDLQTVGKILKITNVNDGKQVARLFEGKNQGEILERRLKRNRRYENLDASTIVSVDIASDTYVAGIDPNIYDAAKIATDETDVTVTVRTEQYWEYLKKVSDYWFDGATKVQKDFYVDTDYELVWKARPIRTTGVETLTVGENIDSYTLIYDILPTKNKITVYGAASAYYPNDKDSETESLDNWTSTWGALVLQAVFIKEGTYSIQCDNDTPPRNLKFKLELPKLNLRDINKLNFWYYTLGTTFAANKVRLHCPDASNCYEADLTIGAGTWYWADFPLGDSAVYDADENPTGIWTATGSPNWWSIQYVEFENTYYANPPAVFIVDKLYFSPDRWVFTAEDAASQTNYGLREAEFTDDNLLSNSECEKRAETLIYQMKEKTIGLEIQTTLNTNIKIGDRVPITLPSENITAINFDVLWVEHQLPISPGEGTTKAGLIYSADKRVFPSRSPLESVQRNLSHLKDVTSELYSRVVR